MRPNFGNPISKTSQGRSRFFNFCFLFQRWHFLIHRIEEKLLEARRCKEAPGLNPLPNCFPSLDTLGKDSCAKSDEFSEKFQGGARGAFSIQKFMLQILGTLNRAFWAWNWYPLPRRMVPISGNHVPAFHAIWPSYPLAFIRPNPLKKLSHNFRKMRGGSKAAWNFSETSSDLAQPSIP